MNVLDQPLVEAVAQRLSTGPGLIEKDWHVTRALEVLATFDHGGSSPACQMSKKAAESVLSDFVTLVTRQLVKGDKIRLNGLGILQVRDRPARTARNPATNQHVQVAASRKIAFRPAKELKEAV